MDIYLSCISCMAAEVVFAIGRTRSNYSDVARFGDAGLVLVMPQGDYAYYLNAVQPPENRYENYIVHDLVSDVEPKFAVAKRRSDRSIVGVSMGGLGLAAHSQ